MKKTNIKKQPKPSELILDLRPVGKQQPISSGFRTFLTGNKTWLLLASILIVLITAYWIFLGPKKTTEQLQLSRVKSLVGQHMLLPVDEEPTLVTVEDKTKVKDPFISKSAENGDQILIYAKNKLAIIYRPSVNKIVTAGNIFADPSLVEADGATIMVLNGSDNAEKTKNIIDELETIYPKADITDGGMANRHDFPTTIVIDNTNAKDYLTDAIAQKINGKRGIVPISESITTTDIMIIVGKD